MILLQRLNNFVEFLFQGNPRRGPEVDYFVESDDGSGARKSDNTQI